MPTVMARFESTTDPSLREKESAGRERSAIAEDADALWRKFGSATSVEDFCTTWLALQCGKIQGVAGGVVLLGAPDEGRPYAPVAFWPDRRQDLRRLAEVAERALTERRGLVIRRQVDSAPSSPPRYDIAYPVQAAGQIYGVVA